MFFSVLESEPKRYGSDLDTAGSLTNPPEPLQSENCLGNDTIYIYLYIWQRLIDRQICVVLEKRVQNDIVATPAGNIGGNHCLRWLPLGMRYFEANVLWFCSKIAL